MVGYADETGTGAGRARPEPAAPARARATSPGSTPSSASPGGRPPTGCTALVVSLGVDAAADDPESPLAVTARATGRPAGSSARWGSRVAVQEGGYHLPSLGGLVAAYLEGHDAGSAP